MKNNIQDKIKKRNPRKVPVNITIDDTLLEKIEEFKEEHQIKQFSPLVNEMLWGFFEESNDIEEEEKKEDKDNNH
jgi:metal-responsive CopG/Arc/MetJ family transcriptional regulator